MGQHGKFQGKLKWTMEIVVFGCRGKIFGRLLSTCVYLEYILSCMAFLRQSGLGFHNKRIIATMAFGERY